METLRMHFGEWLDALDVKEKQTECPEHYMFMVVDHEVLQNIRLQNPVDDHTERDEEPYVKAYDAEAEIDGSAYPAIDCILQ